MDNNNHDNSFELYSRRHSTRDVPASSRIRNDQATKRQSLSTTIDVQLSRQNIDENPNFHISAISIISDGRSCVNQTPSIKLKMNAKRKRSTTNNVLIDKHDSKANRLKGRSTLTSSFLRRKRIEYAGTFHFIY